MQMSDKESAIDTLRRAVKMFDYNNESFNQRFSSTEELILIARACWASDWDVFPDQWTKEQVERALKGEPPKFEETLFGLHAVGVNDCNCRTCRNARVNESNETCNGTCKPKCGECVENDSLKDARRRTQRFT